MNDLTTVSPVLALIPENMDQAIRLAQAMSSAKMVPAHLQGDTGSCLMVIEQAIRWRASPFAVAQCTSNIGGKLCYEGKLIAAILPSAGAIIGELDYAYHGDAKNPETLSVTVSGKRASDGEIKSLTLSWLDAKTKNAYWTSQPEQQLCYAGARVWARRWTPGPLLGIYAPEEMAAERKAAKEDQHDGPTIEHTASDERTAINDAVPLKAAAAPMPRAERKVDPTPYEAPPSSTAPEKRTWAQWKDALELAVKDARTPEERGRLLAKAEVTEIVRLARLGQYSPAKARIIELYEEIENRYLADPPDPPEEPELPEVEIAGAEKMASG